MNIAHTPTTAKTSNLVDPTFLFEFALTLRKASMKWTRGGVKLDDSHTIPALGTLGGRPNFGDLKMAWSDKGIAFALEVMGKAQVPWCREARVDESDGLHLFIDTRNSPGIHRANRFCHRFAFLPTGAGTRRDEPVARMLNIHRARELPTPADADGLKVASKLQKRGYEISGMIPTKSMTGFDPSDYPKLSLWFAVVDREMGWQTLSLGPEYPCMEDPSLWATAEMVE